MKKHILFLSRIAISFVVIAIIWYFLRKNADELISNLRSVNKIYLLAGFLIYTLNAFLLSLRLKIVLSTQDLTLNFKEAVRLTFIGFFFNSFLPTSVGGDIAKGYYASERFHHKKIESYAAIFADRVIGLISIVSIALIALIIIGRDIVTFEIKLLVFCIFALAIFFVFFSLNHHFAYKFKFLLKFFKLLKLDVIVKKAYRVLNNFKNHKKTAAFSLLIAFAGQLLIITSTFILAKSLNLNLPFYIFFLFIPLVSVASMIPSLGGTGPREGAFILLFGHLVGRAAGGALALLWLSYFLSLSMLGGVVYLLSGYHRLTISEIEREIDYDREKVA